MQNRSMTTLGKIAARIDEMSKNCTDHLIPVRDISFDSLDCVRIAGEAHKIRRIAQQSIAYRLGIPIQYLRRCPPDLQAHNMNRWLPEEKNKELFFRFDGEEVRAIFTPKYKPLDNFEVLERLDSLGYPLETPVQCHLDSEFMSLSILDGQQTFSVNKDKFTPGISVANSEIGLSCLSIAAFFLRLICTNGLVSKTEVKASYKHVSLKIFKEFPKVLESVALELAKKKDQLRISAQSKVDNALATIESFNRQFQVDKQAKEATEWAWQREAGDTMFNVVNTYTRAAQFEGLSAEESYRLQKVGGSILEMVQ